MARRTNEQKARDLAAELGVKIDIESSDPRDYAVEIWAFDAHLNIDGAHTAIPSMEGWGLKSPAAVWAAVADLLENGTECPSDCDCRDAETEQPEGPTVEQLNIQARDFKAGDVVTTNSGAELLILESAGCIIGRGISYTTDAGEHVFNAGWTFDVKRPARSYTCTEYSDAEGPVNGELTFSTGEIFTVWHKSSTRSRALVEMQDGPGCPRNRSSARAMADMLNGATLTGLSKIHYDGQKNGFTTTVIFPAA